MKLEKVTQPLWYEGKNPGNTKYAELKDFMETLQTGESFFLNLEEFIEASGGRSEGKTEEQYTFRLYAAVKRFAKNFNYQISIRKHRYNEPVGYWIFRV